MVDDVVHAALDASYEAEALLHVAVRLIEGGIVDQRELSLVKRSDDHHALHSGTGQILVVDVDYEQIAVDLVILLAGDADDAGTGLAHSVCVDQAGAEDVHQKSSGRLVEHLAERCVEAGLMDVKVVLLDVLGNTHQQVLVVVEIVGLVSVDLVHQSLGVDALLDRVGHIFAAENAELLNRRIILFDGAVQGVGAAHGLSCEGIESAVTHGAQPVCCHISVLSGGDQDAERSACGTGSRRYMPVFVLLGILGGLFVHPVTYLVLCEEREFIEVFRAVIIIGRCAGLFKTCAIEGNLISCLHELVNALILLFENSLIVLGINGFSFHIRISSEGQNMLKLVVEFVIVHRFLLINRLYPPGAFSAARVP